MVADALNRKAGSSLAHLRVNYRENLIALRGLNVGFQIGQKGALMATLRIRPVLRERIQAVQSTDPEMDKIMKQIQQGTETPFSM